MRIGYVGLSTPLLFDYANYATRTQADVQSSPNPILDSPFGAMLLFDELWFLTTSLCPENLRQANFVKFVDKLRRSPNIRLIVEQTLQYASWVPTESTHEWEAYVGSFYQNLGDIGDVFQFSSWNERASVDNHTHELKIWGKSVVANPTLQNNLIFDNLMLSALIERFGFGFELITNWLTQQFIDQSEVNEPTFAELMVIDRIPNYLSAAGPWHPCVEEARGNRFLADYRKWVSTVDASSRADQKQAREMKRLVEEGLREVQERVFVRYLDQPSRYDSTAKLAAGLLLETVTHVPMVHVFEAMRDFHENQSASKHRWQGFILTVGASSKPRRPRT